MTPTVGRLSFLKTLLFYAIHIAFFSFAIMSIYDLSQIKIYHELTEHEAYLRNIQNIAVSVVSLMVGFYIAYKFAYFSPSYLLTHNGFSSKTEVNLSAHDKCFIFSSGLFLFITGISGTAINSKKLVDSRSV